MPINPNPPQVSSGDTIPIQFTPSNSTPATEAHTDNVNQLTAHLKGIDTALANTGVADDSITLAKLEHGTQGDILYYSTSGAPARLGYGTSGQFLKTQGSGANPAWGTALTTMPSGTVLQVQSTFLNTSFSSSVSPPTFVDITGLSVNITPVSSSSNILVMFSVSMSSTGNNTSSGVRLLRDSTEIAPATSVANTYSNFREYDNGDTNISRHCVFFMVDSPSSTSATTYKLQGTGQGGETWRINAPGSLTTGQAFSFRDASCIIAIEIKG